MRKLFTLLVLAALGMPALAAAPASSTKVELQSGGPIAFGPGGVLFVGDPKAATVYAIETGDVKNEATGAPAAMKVKKLDAKLAGMLGSKAEELRINDLAVNPASGRVYLSVTRGKSPDSPTALFRVAANGDITEQTLTGVSATKATLAKPTTNARSRQEAITNMKFVGSKLYVAGLSNEEFASTLRVLSFPFDGKDTISSIQIFHGAHGKYETAAPVRTFAAIEVNGQEEILAAYTCTPLVRIPVSELKDGAKVKGTTVAELGNRNRPLDIVPYTKGGKSFVLMANNARGVMKVSLEGIENVSPIATRVPETAGLKYETLKEYTGVEHLDKLGENQIVMLSRSTGGVSLTSIELP